MLLFWHTGACEDEASSTAVWVEDIYASPRRKWVWFLLGYLFISSKPPPLTLPLWILAGVPHLKWFGVEGDYSCMVIDLLGPSLEDLFNYCTRKFTLKSVLMLADQLVSYWVLWIMICPFTLWTMLICSFMDADMQSWVHAFPGFSSPRY